MNIVIIGASQGIGKAIALEFAKQCPKASFLLTYKSHKKGALGTRKEMFREQVPYIMVSHLEIRNRREIRKRISKFSREKGKINILINNAGIAKNDLVEKTKEEEWDEVIETNLSGVFNVSKITIPYMKEGGSIINIGSVTGESGSYGAASYSASKAGIHGLTMSLAKELARRKIRVNTVAPGFIETDLLKGLSEKVKERLRKRTLLNRFGKKEEVAQLVVFLALKGTYCTGQLYLIDGGYLISW